MRILILTNEIFPLPGGIQRYIHLVSKGLGEICGKESVFVMPIYGRYGKTDEYRLVTRIAHLANRWKRFLGPLLFLQEIKRIEPEIVIFNHISLFKYARLTKKLNIPYFVIVYGIEVWRELTGSEIKFLAGASSIISISEFTKRCLIDKAIGPEKIEVLYLGIDTEKFRIIPKRENRIRMDSDHILLTVCRLEASEGYKGYDKIIELLPELGREFPDIKYVIVGDGTDKMRIMKLAKEINASDRIVLPGLITDVDTIIDYYNLCDVFAMPSDFYIRKEKVIGEGFGFVYLEAAACGKPVIAGKGGGCPEAIEDGVTGFLAEPNDKKALYETILKLLRNKVLAKRMGEAGRKRVEEFFSYSIFTKKIKEIFVNV